MNHFSIKDVEALTGIKPHTLRIWEQRYGIPKRILILGIIGSAQGVETVAKKFPGIDIFIGDIDEELTAKSYIVPGLGDAGDLCFGDKVEF